MKPILILSAFLTGLLLVSSRGAEEATPRTVNQEPQLYLHVIVVNSFPMPDAFVAR